MPLLAAVKATLLVVSLVTLLSANSCAGGADDVVRVLGTGIDNVDDLVSRVPKNKLPAGGSGQVTAAAVDNQISRIMTPVRNYDPLTAKTVTGGACEVADLAEVNSFESAFSYVLQKSPTYAGNQETMRSLAKELEKADDSGQVAQVLAKFAICQWANS